MPSDESTAALTSASASASALSLTDAELAVLDAATAHARHHDLAEPAESGYLRELPGARRSILHRLVVGLLRGSPVELPPAITLSGSAPEIPTDAPSPLSRTTAERLLADVDSRSREVAVLPFPASESAFVAPIAARHGYGRIRLDDVHRWRPDGANRVRHPNELVEPLVREGAFPDDEQARRIGAELDESAANLAFARLARRRFVARAPEGDASITEVAAAAPAADPAASLERLVVEGHPFHPAAKIRRGMSPGAALAYAPEFTGRIDLRFVAVHVDHAARVTAAGETSLTDRLYGGFEGLAGTVRESLPAGRSPEEYAVVPVHPWQYHHSLPDRYADRIADGRVVPVPGYTHPATPLLNLRTVVPYATDRTPESPPPHLKLAIGVQTTNVVRTLSPQAVHNGPRVTDVLRSIETRESLSSLGFLDEPATAGYHASGGPHPEGEDYDDARHLAGLLRESPYAHPFVSEGAVPVPASSLLARSPVTDRPLIREVVDRYEETTGAGVDSFLEEYLEAVVPEQLLLLSKYGVALESHAQNSYVVFEEGRPVATLIRDFGGIRALDDRLAAHGIAVDAYPDSDVAADDREDLYRKLYYALFQNHLAELIATLTWHCPIDEATCWRLVRAECERAFEALRADSDVRDRRIARDEGALFADPIEHKALTAMRLRGKRHEYVTSRVPNPLA
ncbi:IucA/IucC family protein [Halalkalicoccus ordinarius]|uniref:IucA/IucC family protein n=1 Tax=Halalkalicoccus ordinarius TaxID=3116651 RepID=UPI00300F7A87